MRAFNDNGYKLGKFSIINKDGTETEVSSETAILEVDIDRNSLDQEDFKLNGNVTIELDGEVNKSVLENLLLKSTPSKVTGTFDIITGWRVSQVKKHKSKRINKKWKKKYGYINIPIYETKEYEMITIKAEDYVGSPFDIGLSDAIKIIMEGDVK